MKEGEPVEEQNAAEVFFLDTFGVPFHWALQMSKMQGPIGDRWRTVLEHINDVVNGEVQTEQESKPQIPS